MQSKKRRPKQSKYTRGLVSFGLAVSTVGIFWPISWEGAAIVFSAVLSSIVLLYIWIDREVRKRDLLAAILNYRQYVLQSQRLKETGYQVHRDAQKEADDKLETILKNADPIVGVLTRLYVSQYLDTQLRMGVTIDKTPDPTTSHEIFSLL